MFGCNICLIQTITFTHKKIEYSRVTSHGINIIVVMGDNSATVLKKMIDKEKKYNTFNNNSIFSL